jgi:fructose-1,6-bisphosphatase/inositol monophosphatase family enzyme
VKPYRETVEPILLYAGQLVLDLRAQGLQHTTKDDGTIVTNADTAASDFITAALLAAYPGTAVLSEEHPDLSGVRAEYTWIIDPIDGTRHFADGGNMFAIMVSLCDTQPLFSMIYHPAINRWYWAERGKGAFLRERGHVRKLHIRTPAEPAAVIYGQSCPYPVGECGGMGIAKYCTKIAQGKIDGFLRTNAPYWDLCPPALLVTEAGGVLVDFDGEPLVYTHADAVQPTLIAGHPRVVAQALAELALLRTPDQASAAAKP